MRKHYSVVPGRAPARDRFDQSLDSRFRGNDGGGPQRRSEGGHRSRRIHHQFTIPPVKPGAGSANSLLVIPAKAGIHIGIPLFCFRGGEGAVTTARGGWAKDPSFSAMDSRFRGNDEGGRGDGPREAVGSRRVRRQFVIPPVAPGAGSANSLLVIPAKAGIHIGIPLFCFRGGEGAVTTARGGWAKDPSFSAMDSRFRGNDEGGRGDGPREAVGSRRVRRQFVIPPVAPGAGSANNPPRHSRESGNPYWYPVSCFRGGAGSR